jgi:hypothetical protein
MDVVRECREEVGWCARADVGGHPGLNFRKRSADHGATVVHIGSFMTFLGVRLVLRRPFAMGPKVLFFFLIPQITFFIIIIITCFLGYFFFFTLKLQRHGIMSCFGPPLRGPLR